MLWLTGLVTVLSGVASGSTKFSTVGSRVILEEGGTQQWVVFRGIGLTCTEYMMKQGMDDKSYPGHWAYTSCFGGPSSDGGPIELNGEQEHVMKYLKSDTNGGEFYLKPNIEKVAFASPYDQVMSSDIPQHHPVVRIPMTGSCYLYDEDVTSGDHNTYVDTLDAIIQYFTNASISVIIDLHWNCPDDTQLAGCTGAQGASMALKKFGSYPGAITMWDTISKKYANNPYVFYELFNEPWIQQFDPWYAGDGTYAGMKEMYEAIRKNDPNGLVIIGGKDQYALDAQSGLAFYLQFKKDTGSYPTGIVWNMHPYQGGGQGLEHSVQSAMRLSLALKQIGPVIFTEFGQYCCGSGGTPCTGSGQCSHHKTGDNFVYNLINYATQYDVSWVGWAWRGNNDDYPCGQTPDCNQPDMRGEDGSLVDGTYAGADWKTVWSKFVAKSTIAVEDVTKGEPIDGDAEPAGYLVRPCIIGDYNLGGICGWDFNTNVTDLTVDDFTSQTLYDSILPGLPPKGDCKSQGCSDFTCQTYTGPCQN